MSELSPLMDQITGADLLAAPDSELVSYIWDYPLQTAAYLDGCGLTKQGFFALGRRLDTETASFLGAVLMGTPPDEAAALSVDQRQAMFRTKSLPSATLPRLAVH